MSINRIFYTEKPMDKWKQIFLWEINWTTLSNISPQNGSNKCQMLGSFKLCFKKYFKISFSFPSWIMYITSNLGLGFSTLYNKMPIKPLSNSTHKKFQNEKYPSNIEWKKKVPNYPKRLKKFLFNLFIFMLN